MQTKLSWAIGLLFIFPTLINAQNKSASYIDASNLLPSELTKPGSMDVESADLDADGDPDLVIAMEGQANLILWNDGKGSFKEYKKLAVKHAPVHHHLTGEDSEDIAIADFDQDGDLDLLFITEDTKHHELMWNDGKGNFSHADYEFPKTYKANALAVADLNGDKYPDVIVGNLGPNQLYINNGDGSFTDASEKWLPDNSDHSQDLKLADIDQDGDLDLIEGAELGGTNLFLRKKNKFIEAEDAFPNLENYETRKVVLGDVNQDGLLDIYLCNVSWNPEKNAQNLLLINKGKAQFEDATAAYLPMAKNTTLDGIFQDFNQDGQLDLMITNGWDSHTYITYLQDKNHYQADSDIFPALDARVGIAIHSIDLNGDGQLDFYIGNHGGKEDFLLLSKLE